MTATQITTTRLNDTLTPKLIRVFNAMHALSVAAAAAAQAEQAFDASDKPYAVLEADEAEWAARQAYSAAWRETGGPSGTVGQDLEAARDASARAWETWAEHVACVDTRCAVEAAGDEVDSAVFALSESDPWRFAKVHNAMNEAYKTSMTRAEGDLTVALQVFAAVASASLLAS